MNTYRICHGVVCPAFPQYGMVNSRDEVFISAINWCCSVCHRKMQNFIFAFKHVAFESDFTPGIVETIRSNEFCFPGPRSEEHTSELQSRGHLVCRLLLEKKNS